MRHFGILIAATVAFFAMSSATTPDDGFNSQEQLDDSEATTTPSQVSRLEASCLQKRAAEEKNKALVMEAYQKVWGDGSVDETSKYYHENVIEHNPLIGDGIKAQQQFAAEWTKGRSKETLDFLKIVAEGDYVWSHAKIKDDSGVDLSIMDIVRIEKGKIVEHWDVIQAVPKPGKSKNPHPLF